MAPREKEERWWEHEGPVKKIFLYLTGTVLFYKIFKIIMSLISSDKQRTREQYPESRGSDTLETVKKVLVIIGIVLVAGFLLFQLFTMVRETLFFDMDVSPGETIGTGIARASNATSNAVESTKVGVMTPFWRSQCQRKLLPQNPENYEQKLENCVREKQGLPPINDTEESREQEWDLKNARNYLDATIYTELVEADYMADVCGQRCGRIETVIRNQGNQPLQLEDLSISLKGNMMDGDYPMIIQSEKAMDKGKKYRLNQFIDGAGRLESWTRIPSMSEDERTLLEGETKTVTFLVNLSRYPTFNREKVVDYLETRKDDLEENTDENTSTDEYCSERGGVYNGEHVSTREGNVLFEQNKDSEKFESFSGDVCMDHVSEAVETNTQTIMGSEDVEPQIRMNYSGQTESVLNLEVWNQENWGNMNSDERESKRNEECRTIGTGNTLKQTSETSPGDVVAFLMYTDCEILYSEDASQNQMILDIQAKADKSRVDNFRIDNVEDISGGSVRLCDDFIENEDPTEAYKESGWFKIDRDDWNSPRTACYVDIPSTDTSASLNLGISAEYTASTTESSVIRLD